MRGKPTPQAKVHQALALMAIEPDMQKVSQEMQLPVETLRSIKKRGITDPEFVRLHAENKQQFVQSAWMMIFEFLGDLRGRKDELTPKDLIVGLGVLTDKVSGLMGENAPSVQVNQQFQDNRVINLPDTAGWSVEDKKRLLMDHAYRPDQPTLKGGEPPLPQTESVSS